MFVLLVAVAHLSHGIRAVEPTHPLSGYAISIVQGLAFSVAFIASGVLLGRYSLRKIPGFFNYKYAPAQAWPLLFILTLFIIENYVVRVIESYVVYGEMMREGIWVFVWGVLCAYGAAVGYAGKLTGFSSLD